MHPYILIASRAQVLNSVFCFGVITSANNYDYCIKLSKASLRNFNEIENDAKRKIGCSICFRAVKIRVSQYVTFKTWLWLGLTTQPQSATRALFGCSALQYPCVMH